jgi:uncharacterized protein YlzI (FlbEa/FlbD family)
MIALMTTAGRPVAIEPDMIESVESGDANPMGETCVIRTSSGKEHIVRRSYTYVTGIVRRHYETH